MTALKHFPGHGSSKADTHLGIADVTNTWEERELKPYKVLIDSGYADAVMTSHIVNRKLDKAGNPGTLSADILTGILRNQLHFDGVVFTDDMQMQAITKHYGLEEAIRLAIKGGVDIMTFSNNLQDREARIVDIVHGIIKKMIANGEINEARIDQSFRRIMKLKQRLSANDGIAQYEQALEQSAIALEKATKELHTSQERIKALEQQPVVQQTAEPSKKKSKRKRRG